MNLNNSGCIFELAVCFGFQFPASFYAFTSRRYQEWIERNKVSRKNNDEDDNDDVSGGKKGTKNSSSETHFIFINFSCLDAGTLTLENVSPSQGWLAFGLRRDFMVSGWRPQAQLDLRFHSALRESLAPCDSRCKGF